MAGNRFIDMTNWVMSEHGVSDSYVKVLYRDIQYEKDNNKYKKAFWRCECLLCHNQFVAEGVKLRAGRTKSCGCMRHIIRKPSSKKRDLKGQIFGKWLVLEEDFEYKVQNNIYSGSAYWKCQCQCEYQTIKTMPMDTLVRGRSFQCDYCHKSGSVGENLIKQLLLDNNISFEEEKKFDTCRFKDTGYLARFDFYIDNKYLLEFDGEQHYHKTGFESTTRSTLEEVQKRDKFKNQWCKDNNIPLIRIPYTILKDLTINDLLLDKSKYLLN